MVATYTDIFVFCFLLTELTAHAHGKRAMILKSTDRGMKGSKCQNHVRHTHLGARKMWIRN